MRALILVSVSLVILSTVEPRAEEAVGAFDTLRLRVGQADLIVRGTLVDVHVRDLLLQGRTSRKRTEYDMYFDTGKIVVSEVLWGSTRSDTVDICFPSQTRWTRNRDSAGTKSQFEAYHEGETGYWMLEPLIRHIPYRMLPGAPYHLVAENAEYANRIPSLIEERKQRPTERLLK